MPFLASLTITAKLGTSGTIPAAELSLVLKKATPDYGRLPRFDVALTLGVREAAFVTSATELPGPNPAGPGENIEGRRQILGSFRIAIGGVAIEPSSLLPNMSVTENDDGTRLFSFAMPLTSSAIGLEEPLGDPVDMAGPPPGKATIDIDAVYLTPDGVKLVRLITNGYIENSSSSRTLSGRVRTFNGVGPEGRYDKKTIDLTLPPGHGSEIGEIVTQILDQMDLTATVDVQASSVSDVMEKNRYKEFTAVDANGRKAIANLLNTQGLYLDHGRDDVPIIRRNRFDATKPVDWSVDEQGILGAVSDSPDNEGPTTVRVIGEAQIIGDDGSENGCRTEVQKIETFSVTLKPEFTTLKTVVSGCGTTPVSFPHNTVPMLVKVQTIEFEREYCGSTLISELVKTFEWYNPRCQRGIQQSDGTIGSCIAGRYLVDASSPTVLFASERWMQVREDLLVNTFDSTTNYLSQAVRTIKKMAHLEVRNATVTLGGGGEIQFTYPAEDMMDDGRTIKSEATNFVEQLRLTNRETKTYTVTEDGFIVSETELRESLRAKSTSVGAGNTWFKRWGYSFDTFTSVQASGSTVIAYSATGDSSSVEVRTTYDDNGGLIGLVRSDLTSYLPAAAQLDVGESLDPANFPNGKVAVRGKTQGLEAEFTSEKLEAFREPARQIINNGWIESNDEASELAFATVQELSAISYNFTLPFNALVTANDRAIATVGGRERDVYISQVRHEITNGPSGPEGRTQVAGRIFVI